VEIAVGAVNIGVVKIVNAVMQRRETKTQTKLPTHKPKTRASPKSLTRAIQDALTSHGRDVHAVEIVAEIAVIELVSKTIKLPRRTNPRQGQNDNRLKTQKQMVIVKRKINLKQMVIVDKRANQDQRVIVNSRVNPNRLQGLTLARVKLENRALKVLENLKQLRRPNQRDSSNPKSQGKVKNPRLVIRTRLMRRSRIPPEQKQRPSLRNQ
jgi:hypothetical protein